MAKKLPSLGELELQVLRLVWAHQPCTERQITDLIQPERAVARTTVLKTMQRLEGKGLLKRLPGKGSVRFQATVDEERVLPELIGKFVNGVLGGSAEPLVAYLADSSTLNAKDLRALQEIVRKLEADSS